MGFQNIEKKNIWYIILRDVITSKWLNHIFFRRVTVNYSERIPKTGHLIFTPNHQNALIDAMGPLCNINKQLIFMARSDIFKKKAVAEILYFLKILPIFRIRDGYGELKKNEPVFKKTIEVLNSGNGLVIFPEGNHETIRKLKPFKKGYARVAFQTAEANNFEVDLKIVPVGLNYSDYYHLRSDLTINIGEPISVSEFYDLYKESPAIAINELNKKLRERLSQVFIHIESVDDYEMIDSLSVFYRAEMGKKLDLKSDIGLDAFKSEKKIVSLLEKEEIKNPDSYSSIRSEFENYNGLIKRTGIKNNLQNNGDLSFSNLLMNIFISFVGFPLFLYGLINNLFPYLLTKYFTTKIKDVTFKSSFSFVISLVTFPVFYLIQLILVIMFIQPWWIWILYALSLPASAAFALDYSIYMKKLFRKFQWILFKKKNKIEFEKIKIAKQDLIDSLNKIKLS